MSPIAPTFVALLALAPLAAQATTTTVAAPAPHITIETVGPEGWRARLGPTNLGGLLASAKGRELWEPLTEQMFEAWQRATGGTEGFAAAKARLLGYAGRVRADVWMGKDGPERVALLIANDARTDTKALAADMRRMFESSGEKWQPTTLGSETIDALVHGDDRCSAPLLAGEHIVLAIAPNDAFGATLEHARKLAAAADRKIPPMTTPALRVDVDWPALIALAKTLAPRQVTPMIEAFGYESLGRMQVTLGTAGPHVMAELAQQFAPAPKGLFAAFCTPATAVPALQRAAPKQGSWRAGHFDFRALCETVFAVIDSERRNDDSKTRDLAKKELGIDPVDDLLAHATTEVLVLGSPMQAIDRPDDVTWAIALRLRDEKKFAQGLATMLEKTRPMLQRGEPQTIEGVEFHRYGNAINYKLWIGTGHDTLFFAAGREAEERLTQVVAAVKKPADAAPGADAAAGAFADLAKHLPAGLNARARVDLDVLFALPLELWRDLLYEILPGELRGELQGEPKWTEEDSKRVRALLVDNNLLAVRTATGYADSTWRWRLFW